MMTGGAIINCVMGYVWMLLSFVFWEFEIQGDWLGSITVVLVFITIVMVAEHWYWCSSWRAGEAPPDTTFSSHKEDESQDEQHRAEQMTNSTTTEQNSARAAGTNNPLTSNADLEQAVEALVVAINEFNQVLQSNHLSKQTTNNKADDAGDNKRDTCF